MIRLGHQAVERGVTLFDTAPSDGPFTNEELAAEIFAPFKNKVVVTTKFGYAFTSTAANQPRVLKS